MSPYYGLDKTRFVLLSSWLFSPLVIEGTLALLRTYAIFLCFRDIQNLFEPCFLNTGNIHHFILYIEFQLLLSLFLSLVR